MINNLKQLISATSSYSRNFEELLELVLTRSLKLLEFEELLQNITLEDLRATSREFEPGSIGCIELYEDEHFSLSVFFMSKETTFPLHDHPQMLAVAHIVQGKIEYQNYNINKNSSFTYEGELVAEGEASSGQTLYLTPDWGNVHSVHALQDTVLIDIFCPGYSDERECTFYREVNTNIFIEWYPIFDCRYLQYAGGPIFN